MERTYTYTHTHIQTEGKTISSSAPHFMAEDNQHAVIQYWLACVMTKGDLCALEPKSPLNLLISMTYMRFGAHMAMG